MIGSVIGSSSVSSTARMASISGGFMVFSSSTPCEPSESGFVGLAPLQVRRSFCKSECVVDAVSPFNPVVSPCPPLADSLALHDTRGGPPTSNDRKFLPLLGALLGGCSGSKKVADRRCGPLPEVLQLVYDDTSRPCRAVRIPTRRDALPALILLCPGQVVFWQVRDHLLSQEPWMSF